MKERPILFSANMVRAILADNKTQTRRTINTRTVKENNMTCRCGAIDCPSCCPDSFVRSGGRMFYADDLDGEELEADIIADEEYEVNQTIDREQRTRDD